jgi:mono/diheme cytochrome c family protein
MGDATQKFTGAELLARPDAATIEIPKDASYSQTMSYRAVPLRALLPALQADKTDTMEMRATDGFVAQLPSALIEGEATPWIAVEDPAHPWPLVPGKTISAGPFYLVWQNPERAGISPEQWPYALASLTAVASPLQRWPAIAVDKSVPAKAPARRGQEVFITNCLTCHRLGGGGEGAAGPDLLRPMPATAYFTDAGLRALIRDPASVRDWPEQQMPAFDAKVIADADIDAIIAYLRYMAAHPK